MKQLFEEIQYITISFSGFAFSYMLYMIGIFFPNSRNIWKYNLMHLTHDNTFTVHYIKDFPPYWQYNTVTTAP